jgi:HTH-type transcriptional regulator, glycine betaine synthesis regulator
MFIRVIRERKRREIDPTADALRECLAMIPPEKAEAATILRQRLESLLEIFNLIDAAYRQVFNSDQAAMQLREMLLNPDPKPLIPSP